MPLLRIPMPGSAEAGGRTPRGGPSGIPKPAPSQPGGRGGQVNWQGGDRRDRPNPVAPLSAAAAYLQTPRSKSRCIPGRNALNPRLLLAAAFKASKEQNHLRREAPRAAVVCRHT